LFALAFALSVAVNPDEVFEKYKDSWYSSSSRHWSQQPPTVDGMLGGGPELSEVDVSMSRDLIAKYQNPPRILGKPPLPPLGNQTVAECGCGIGRVSHYVLKDFFKEVDLIEPVESFLETAVKTVKNDSVTVRGFHSGAQDWQPDRFYDAFWNQWILMYLTDEDAIPFLQRCKAHLNPNGLIFVKDHVAGDRLDAKKEEAQLGVEEWAICRVYSHYLELFEAAELTIVEVTEQDGWPDNLVPVFCFVLR
jgi:protein N-terminal methyltransferase